MFTLFHVGNNNIFMWFHEKNWIIRKLKILRKKSAILCNLPFWLEIHFDPYLKNQLTLQLLLYLFWKLFLWCLKRGLVGSYTYDTFNAILEKPSLIFYESVFIFDWMPWSGKRNVIEHHISNKDSTNKRKYKKLLD